MASLSALTIHCLSSVVVRVSIYSVLGFVLASIHSTLAMTILIFRHNWSLAVCTTLPPMCLASSALSLTVN